MITVLKWLALYIIHNICILHRYAKKCKGKNNKKSGENDTTASQKVGENNTTASQKVGKKMIQQPANRNSTLSASSAKS